MSGNRTVTVASNALTVGGAIADGGSGYGLTKAGAGTLILTGAETYAGATTVSGGTLQIGAGGGTGSIDGTSTVTDNAVLAFSRSDTVTFSKVIGGSGNVTFLGPGTLILTPRTPTAAAQRSAAAPCKSATRPRWIGRHRRWLSPTAFSTWKATASASAQLPAPDHRQPVRVRHVDVDRRQRRRQQHLLGNRKEHNGLHRPDEGGHGHFVLGGSNTYSGGTTLSAGQLNLNNASALGSGPFTICSGTIGNTSGRAITLSANNAQKLERRLHLRRANNLNLGSGLVTMSGNRTVTVASNTLTVGGTIADSGSGYSLTKAGAGTLVLGRLGHLQRRHHGRRRPAGVRQHRGDSHRRRQYHHPERRRGARCRRLPDRDGLAWQQRH